VSANDGEGELIQDEEDSAVEEYAAPTETQMVEKKQECSIM
jgi:hypothetical protein